MADSYALVKSTNTNEYATFADYDIASGEDFTIELLFYNDAIGGSGYRVLGQSANTRSDLFVGNDRFQMQNLENADALCTFPTMGFQDDFDNGNVWKLTITRASNVLSGVAVDQTTLIEHTSTTATQSGSFKFNQFFRHGAFGTGGFFTTQSFKFNNDRHYKNTVSGTGSVWTDILGNGSTDATLVGFPTDGSQWLLYDDGGALTNYTITLESGTATATGQDISLTKNGTHPVSNDAYYLENTAKNGVRVVLDVPITIGANVGDFIEFDAVGYAGNSGDGYRLSGVADSFSDTIEVQPSRVNVTANSTPTFFDVNYTHPAINQRFKLKVQKINANQFEVFLDDSSVGISNVTNDLDVSVFFGFSTSQNATLIGAFYQITASTNGGVITNRWNPTASSGTGLTLIDEVGGNNGTLTGSWPNDNSQWILYGDGTATYTITLDAGQVSANGTAIELKASRMLNLDAGIASFVGQNTNLLASRAISIDSGTATFNGQSINLTYSQLNGYTITLESGNASAQGNDINLIANRRIEAETAQIQASGNVIDLLAHRRLQAQSGIASFTGDPLNFLYSRRLNIESGQATFTGSQVTLDYSGFVSVRVDGYTMRFEQALIQPMYKHN